ncbi:MAG: ribose 5-phosphate isomerase A [Thermosphaera sp.]
MSSAPESSKKRAAVDACNLVRTAFSDARIIGIGTGSTIKYFIEACLDFLSTKSLVTSSFDTGIYLRSKGVKSILDISYAESIDVYVDGADEVSSKLDLIKGRGGAFLREKTLALRASERIYVVDHSKYTGKPYLYLKPVPIEVIQLALPNVVKSLRLLEEAEVLLRFDNSKDGPVVTDNGNFIIDLKFSKPLENPAKIHEKLKLIHGVVDTGIFPSYLVDYVVIGYDKESLIVKKTEPG